MADLRQTRQKLKVAMLVLGAVDVVALLVLFSPLVGSSNSRNDRLSALGQQVQLKARQVEPLHDLDKKIVLAQKQIDQFYKDRMPGHASAISEALGKLAGESGVKIGGVKYSMKEGAELGLQPVEIDADFSGDYLHLVRFINAMEREQVFFIIDSVDLGGAQQGAVKLQVKLETYLRTA